MNPEANKLLKSRLQLLLLAALFVAPFLAAAIFAVFPAIQPQGRVNHGVLVTPPIDLSTSLSTFKGKWLLLQIGATQCDAICLERLHLSRQTWLALNEKRARVQRIYVTSVGNGNNNLNLSKEHEDLAYLELNLPKAKIGDYYLIDPRGYWMMTYPQPSILDKEAIQKDFKGLQKDIKKLLKLVG
jgi:cytochrome oxidase Cu insertion factor (SCO1/SenC/PrrC family)